MDTIRMTTDDICKGKTSWPELVGLKGEDAAAIIEKENKHVNAIVVKEGAPGTLDYRCDRVRIIVDDDGVVIQTPVVG